MVFESIQVMDGDKTENIPDLLMADESDQVDAMEAEEKYGIQSIFKVRCEILNIDHDPTEAPPVTKEDDLKEVLLDGLLSDESDSSHEESLRLAFVLPASRALNLLDKMNEQFKLVVPV